MPKIFGTQKLIDLFVEGFGLLQNSEQITPPELQLQKVELLNDTTLVATIIPSTTDSLGVKTEACTTMSAMVGFFREDLALPPNVKNLAVRAFTEDGEELMYVLSSVEVARWCAEGRAIEWLTNSLFVDNTPDFRRARAKLLVSRIEIGLRRIITLRLSAALGTDWWASVAQPIRASSERAMKKEAASGTVTGYPIDYTYLPQLKEIVTAFWIHFRDIFNDQGQFEKAMDDLNAIRRPEAHNREISQTQIEALDSIYEDFAGKMVGVDSGVVPAYLVENWRTRMAEILQETAGRMPAITAAGRSNPDLIRQTFETQVDALKDGLDRLRSVVVPPGKTDLHKRFESTWADLCAEANGMLDAADAKDITALEAASSRYEALFSALKLLAAEHLMTELGH